MVGIFQSGLNEAIENGTGNYRDVLDGSVRRADIETGRVSGTGELSDQLTAKKPRQNTHTAARAVNVDVTTAEADLASTPSGNRHTQSRQISCDH